MSKDQATAVLNYFSKQLDMDTLSFDSANNVDMNLDDIGVILHYSEELEALVFNFLICPLDSQDLETNNDMLHTIMCGNYLWSQTAGGVLGIDSKSDILCLSKLFELDENDTEAEYSALLENFASLVGVARYWRDFVEKVSGGTSSSATNDDAFSNNMLMI